MHEFQTSLEEFWLDVSWVGRLLRYKSNFSFERIYNFHNVILIILLLRHNVFIHTKYVETTVEKVYDSKIFYYDDLYFARC